MVTATFSRCITPFLPSTCCRSGPVGGDSPIWQNRPPGLYLLVKKKRRQGLRSQTDSLPAIHTETYSKSKVSSEQIGLARQNANAATCPWARDRPFGFRSKAHGRAAPPRLRLRCGAFDRDENSPAAKLLSGSAKSYHHILVIETSSSQCVPCRM